MKLFKRMKDGGPESKVEGFWLIEAKSLFSVVLLHFSDGSREAYHSHAFNAISWLLKGALIEHRILRWMGPSATSTNSRDFSPMQPYLSIFEPSIVPIVTTRRNMHKVTSVGDSWVLSFRGPWAKQWREYLPASEELRTLESGRRVVNAELVNNG